MNADRLARRLSPVIALIAIAAWPTVLVAQSSDFSAAAPRVSAGVEVQSFSFAAPSAVGARSATLVVLPFAARLLALPAFSLDVAGAYARGAVTDASGGTATLSGLTDTELRATVRTVGESSALSLTADALLPTGHATLGTGEMPVAGLVSSNLLPFRISNWGFGGGADIEVSASHGGAAGSIGATVGYRLAERFQPIAASAVRYRPGNAASERVVGELTTSGGGMLSIELAASEYASDRWNGTSLLKPGERLFALAGLAVPVGYVASASFYGGALYRSGGALSQSLALSGLLAGVQAPPSETLLLAGASVRLPWGESVLVPALDFRALRRADGTGQGWLATVGTSAELPLGTGNVHLVPSLRLHLGRLLVSKGLQSGVQGLDLAVGLGFGGGQ